MKRQLKWQTGRKRVHTYVYSSLNSRFLSFCSVVLTCSYMNETREEKARVHYSLQVILSYHTITIIMLWLLPFLRVLSTPVCKWYDMFSSVALSFCLVCRRADRLCFESGFGFLIFLQLWNTRRPQKKSVSCISVTFPMHTYTQIHTGLRRMLLLVYVSSSRLPRLLVGKNAFLSLFPSNSISRLR